MNRAADSQTRGKYPDFISAKTAVFELRPGEKLELLPKPPNEGLWFGFRILTVRFPEDEDGDDIAILVGARKRFDGKWDLLHFAPHTRQVLLGMVERQGAIDSVDCWYCIRVTYCPGECMDVHGQVGSRQ